jgi:SAM-dependent methyltransferase
MGMQIKKLVMKSSFHQFWDRFKLSFNQIENSIHEFENSYKGVSYEALYTSKEDLDLIFNDPNISGTFLDLGCGQGQTVLYYALKFPDRKAIGIEFHNSRFDFAVGVQRELELKNAHFNQHDLLFCEIPKADTYFLYFPTGPVLDRLLTALYEGMNPFNIVVIESHGDLIKRIELENWLIPIQEVKLASKRHYPNAVIYKRLFLERDHSLSPFLFSYQKRFLLISETGVTWIGESYGMEWLSGSQFNLKVPPRTICWENVKKLMFFENFDPLTKFALSLRSFDELTFTVNGSHIKASIRKIIIEPTFMIELSSGERLQWNEITSIYRGSDLCYDSSYVV